MSATSAAGIGGSGGRPRRRGRRTSPESSPGGQKGPRVGAFEWGEDAASIGGKATAGLGRKRRRRAAEAAGWFGSSSTARYGGRGGVAQRAEHHGLGPVTIWPPGGAPAMRSTTRGRSGAAARRGRGSGEEKGEGGRGARPRARWRGKGTRGERGSTGRKRSRGAQGL